MTLAQAIIRDALASRPAFGIPGRLFIDSDSGDWYYDDGSAWVPVLTTPLMNLPPQTADAMDDEFVGPSLDGKWTLYDPAGVTANVTRSFNEGWYSMAALPTVSAHCFAILQNTPGTTWKIQMHVAIDAATYNYFAVGCWVRAAGGNKNVFGGLIMHGTYGQSTAWVVRCNGDSFSSEQDCYNMATADFYLEVENDATYIYFRLSQTGAKYTEFYKETIAGFLGASPSDVGFGMYPQGDGSTNPRMGMTASIDWFRRVA